MGLIIDKIVNKAKNPKLASALVRLDLINSEKISELAFALLANGYDSPALRSLAAEFNPIASDWKPVFNKFMAELETQIPTRFEASRIVAQQIAKMILENEITPKEGAQTIWDTFHLVDGFASEITIFEELAWALDEGPFPKPFSELNREQIENKIFNEAKKLCREE